MLGLFGPVPAQDQDPAYVDNVRMSVKTGKVYISYDLIDSDADRKHNVELKFISDKHQLISPQTLNGDIGPSVTAGPDKTIVWNIQTDVNSLRGKMSPKVVLDHNLFSAVHNGGPENAWYSVLMPGLGDYKVASPREMNLPPYFRTTVSWGCIGLGIVAAVKRHEGEGHIETYIPQFGWYNRNLTYDASLKTRWVEGPTQYWLFRGDAEVFIAAGLVVWIYDILWVSSKGRSNQLLMKSIENQQLSLVPVPYGLALSYRISF